MKQIVFMCCVLLGGSALFGADAFWDTSDTAGLQAGSGTWDGGTINWNPLSDGTGVRAAWTASDDAFFNASGASTITAGTVTANGITVNGTGQTVNGGTLTLGAGGITANQSFSYNANTTLGATQTWTAAGGTTVTVNPSVSIVNGGNDLILDGAGTFTFPSFRNNRFNGGGQLILNGSGTVNLNGGFGGSQSNHGGIVVNDGILNINASAWDWNGSTGASLTVNNGAHVNVTVPHIFGHNANDNDLFINGGTINMNNNEVYIDSITMTGGTIQNGSGGSFRTTFGQFNLTTLPSAQTATINGNIDRVSGGPIHFEIADGAAAVDLQYNGEVFIDPIGLRKAGAGTMVANGDLNHQSFTSVNAGTLVLNGSINTGNAIDIGDLNATTATVTMNSGSLIRGQVSLGVNGGTGILNLEGGSLHTNEFNIDAGSTFNWGEGLLTVSQANANGSDGMIDYSELGAVGEPIRSGSTLTVTGDLETTANSVLTLGNVYINDGKRFDNMVVSGELDLSAIGDTLNAIDSLYFLRSQDGGSSDVGSLPLVTADSINGVFENWTGPLSDGIGYEEYTGVFTTAAALPVDTWYLEYTSDQIILHYRLIGSVPEPGTVGMGLLGLILVNTMRSRGRRSV